MREGRLQQLGLNVLVPSEEDRETVHRVIYDELCLGKVEPESRDAFLDIIEKLTAQGATAIIEGCTEIGMLVEQEHTEVTLFDTTRIHAEQAVALALK